jgi:hypothetical protein
VAAQLAAPQEGLSSVSIITIKSQKIILYRAGREAKTTDTLASTTVYDFQQENTSKNSD